MFNALTDKKYIFKYNNKDFEIYNQDLISELLGTNNQNPVNIASSAFKKVIRRNNPKREYINPKYFELKDFFLKHLLIEKEKMNQEEFNKKNSENLNNFKNSQEFRSQVLKVIVNDSLQFKENIPMDYTYIVLCIYLAIRHSYYSVNEIDKLLPFKFDSEEDFLKKYFEIFYKDFKINNLNCFCYRSYFWIDYRLSESPSSEIHNILFNILQELEEESANIDPETKLTIEKDVTYSPRDMPIRSLLSEKQFRVPHNQREYKWTKLQTQRFMDDFFDIYKNPKEIQKYFLGSVVLIKRDFGIKKNFGYEIVDGQQRLTTVILLLEAFKDFVDDPDVKEQLQSIKTFKDFDSEENRKTFDRLILNKNNQTFFRNYIVDERSEEYRNNCVKDDDFRRNQQIVSNFKVIREILDKEYEKEKNKSKKKFILELLTLLETKIYLIVIEVENERSSYRIFETLNDRGMQLSDYENIKNYIFGRSYSLSYNTIVNMWHSMIGTYGKKFENYLDQVYRSKYFSKYKNVDKYKNLFYHFKNNKEIDKNDYYNFTLELIKEIEIYSNLREPTEDYWKRPTELEKLRILQSFNVKSIYLILLSAYIKKMNFNSVLNVCLEFVFKNKFSKNLPFNAGETYHQISYEIRRGGITSTDEIKERLNVLITNTTNNIKSNFLEGEIYNERNKKFSRRILSILNKNTTYSFDMFDKFSVEHIFSESSDDEFKELVKGIESETKNTPQEIRYNKNSIYNLTILPPKENEKIKNKSFKDKLPKYKEFDKIPTNNLLGQHPEFNKELIIAYKEFLWEKVKQIFHLEE